MKKQLALWLTFLKIGAFTFGGGYAMLALLEHELIDRKHWLTRQEFLDMIAISESTPGPIAINSATYLGYRIGGVRGAAIATTAVSLPSLIIIYCISLMLDQFLQLSLVNNAFRGIQVCVVYLIFSAGLRMVKTMEKNKWNWTILCLVSAVMLCSALFAFSFSSVFYILICGAAGIAAYQINRLRHRKGGSL